MKPMNFRKLNSAIIPEASPKVRAARGAVLRLFDLRRRKSEADQRVEKARAALVRVDVAKLEAEFAAALAEQEALAEQIGALTMPAGEEVAA